LNSRGLGCPRAAYAVAGLAWEAAMRGPQIWAERNLPEIIERIVRELL
jgi:hypothetical protein